MVVNAQSKAELRLRKADRCFDHIAYVKAKNLYEKVLKDTAESDHITMRLAECYFYIEDWKNAEKWLEKAVMIKRVDPNYFNLYGQTLKGLGNNIQGDKWINKFQKSKESKNLEYVNTSSYLQRLMGSKEDVKVINLSINSDMSDFGATYFKDSTVIFASNRDANWSLIKTNYSRNEHPFLDVFQATGNYENLKDVKEFYKKIDSKFHDGPLCFSKDFTTMYLSRNNYNNKKEGHSSDEIDKIKLYRSHFNNGEWGALEELPFNSNEYSVGQACLSKDGKKMYFVSDMPGGKGGTDIYSVDIYRDGSNGASNQPTAASTSTFDEKFGPVVNLGEKINSAENEMFPFIDTAGNLFFSSGGHPGLGHLDVFYTKMKKDGTCGKIRNLGPPINSPLDDFSFIMNTQRNAGYFASNRDSGKGDDDIYSFHSITPMKLNLIVKGNILDEHTRESIPFAMVYLKDADTDSLLNQMKTDSLGAYTFDIDEETNYFLSATKDKYADKKAFISTEALSEEELEIVKDISLSKNLGFLLTAIVTDKETGIVLPGVKIKLTNKVKPESDALVTAADGSIHRKLLENKINDTIIYQFSLEREGYLSKTVVYKKKLSYFGEYLAHVELDFSMNKIDLGADLAKIVDIKPIYFDLGKSNIRKDAAIELGKIVKIMSENPNMIIELGSHTDCRSSIASNMKLSDKRAKSSAAYIVSKGIDSKRIYGKGYGESKLINGCACEGDVKSDCPEEEHQKNRRTEFIIIKM